MLRYLLRQAKNIIYNHRWRPPAQPIILMYHRVAETVSDPWGLAVRPEYFAQQLHILKKQAYPMKLRDLVQARQRGRIPPRAVALTFDDGYADNFHQALPLLKRYDIPATIFITTGQLGNRRQFWWDELERSFLRPGTLPATLSLVIQAQTHHWNLAEARQYSQTDYKDFGRVLAWEAPPNSRLALYYEIWQRLQPLPAPERQKALDQIATWAKLDVAAPSSPQAMTLAELKQLAADPLIEIGAHTVTHPFMPAHPVSVQAQEIRSSKIFLEKHVGQPVTSFSYPYGNYSLETTALVQEAGFRCACTVEPRRVQTDDDLYQLPRLEIRDWDSVTFTKKILSYQ